MALWTRRRALATGLLLPGLAHAAGRGTRIEHDETELVDDLTGRSLSRLTDPAVLHHLPHYHHHFLSKNNRFLILGGEADGTRQIHYYDLRRNRSTQLTEGTGTLAYSATLDEAEEQVFFLQGDALKRTSLKGRGEHAMFRCPSGWRFTGHMSLSADARSAAVVEMREDDSRDDPAEQFAGRPQCRIRLIELESGRDEVVVTERAWLVHPQFRPGRRELLYGHEGPVGQVADRLHWIGVDGKGGAPIRSKKSGRTERGYWAPDGSEVRFVHYPDESLRAATICGLVPETGAERRIAGCSAFGWMHENVDGSALVGASRRPSGPNIYVLFPRLDREITICEHGASGKSYPVAGSDGTDYECARPETFFSTDSRWVYFVSDRDGKPAVYRMDVEDLVETT
jgi:oligogalacturonide lyase